MTDKEKKFCDEYLIHMNATRAYKTAYPHISNDHSARSLASKLLTKADVRGYIDEQLAKMHDERTADAKEVMEYLTSVLRGESEAEVVVVEGEGEGYSKAKRMKKTPDEKERLKAAELLGKRFGLFRDKVDVSSDSPVVIINDLEN